MATIRAKRPTAKRIDIMTIIRCPKKRLVPMPINRRSVPVPDHEATKQDCHVPEYVDAALAKVAANHPDLVSIAPKFEATACAAKIDGIHLHEQDGPSSAPIASYYKSRP